MVEVSAMLYEKRSLLEIREKIQKRKPIGNVKAVFVTCSNLQNFLIVKSTNSIKQETHFISLVERVLKLLGNPNVGNEFEDSYVKADARYMELDEIDSVYDVDFTNHTFQTYESDILKDFGKKIPGDLEKLETIGEKKREIMDILKVSFNSLCVFRKRNTTKNHIQKLKLFFRKKTWIYLKTRFLELQSIMSPLLAMIVQLLQSLSQMTMIIWYHRYYTCPREGVHVVSIH